MSRSNFNNTQFKFELFCFIFCILALGGTLITLFVASLSFETSRILLEAQRVLFLRTGMYAMRLPTTALAFNYLWITDYLALVYWTFTKVAMWQLRRFKNEKFLFFSLQTHTGEVKSYPEIAAFTLGPSFSTLVHTATAVSCLGGCVGTLIFLGTHACMHYSSALKLMGKAMPVFSPPTIHDYSTTITSTFYSLVWIMPCELIDV